MKLKAYCMPWHLNKSDAFRDILVEALEDRLKIDLVDIKQWQPDADSAQIFCQVSPPKQVLENPDSKAIWIPMWDNVHGQPQTWWDGLPKHIKVVCFSEAAFERASQARLHCLRLAYFKNPEMLEPAQWNKTVIQYWNRTGLISADFVKRLCQVVNADKLIFRPDLDPGAPAHLHYELPDRIGSTQVLTIGETDHQTYFNIASEANIYIAPRSVEGVGLTFIEALSRGSAVMAYDGSTMNEYIRHRENGYLCSNAYAARWPSRLRRLPAKLIGQQTPRPLPDFTLSDHQPWKDIASLNWEKLGRQAAADHRDGYAAWLKSIDDYCSFLTDW